MDRNLSNNSRHNFGPKSLSARRAWIEICVGQAAADIHPVALRKESVDRNFPQHRKLGYDVVALHKESVDRNCRVRLCPVCQWVALRKESVDRNIGCPAILTVGGLSLSARRAWIEIRTA